MFIRNCYYGRATVSRSVRGMLIGAVLIGMTIVPFLETNANSSDVLKSISSKSAVPAKNNRVAQQPRPASAPNGGYNGRPVMLVGTIESVQ